MDAGWGSKADLGWRRDGEGDVPKRSGTVGPRHASTVGPIPHCTLDDFKLSIASGGHDSEGEVCLKIRSTDLYQQALGDTIAVDTIDVFLDDCGIQNGIFDQGTREDTDCLIFTVREEQICTTIGCEKFLHRTYPIDNVGCLGRPA